MKTTHATARAFAVLPVLLVIAAVTGVTWIVKPSLFPGASHRAAVSTETTANLVTAENKKDAFAAASVVKIQEANAAAPESPAKSFISQESALTLTNLPAPDATALLEAERRRAAVFAGQLEESRRLYAIAASNSEKLTRERDAALSARREADTALTVAAATEHASSVQKLGLLCAAVLALCLWVYGKIYGITPATLGTVVADIRSGVNPIQALDTNLAPWMHARVALAAKIAAPPPAPPSVQAGNP